MKRTLNLTLMILSLSAASSVFAETAPAAPVGSTGLCKDGSYTSNATKNGACMGHKGVKDWYSGAVSQHPAGAPRASVSPMATSAPTTSIVTSKDKIVKSKQAPKTGMVAAPGGGVGQVWVNSASKVYHCVGTKFYGRTKHGEYKTEAAAIASGDHADHGKKCSEK